MATRLTDEFPARTKAPTAAYPDGSYMNETAPGANDGTPLDERIGDDYEGLKQGLLDKAGIVPNGQPDSVTNPQQIQAIEKFIGDGDSQLAGGAIWPLSSQDSAQVGDDGLVDVIRINAQGGNFPSNTQFRLLNKDRSKSSASGEITALNLTTIPYDCTIGGDNFWLSQVKYPEFDLRSWGATPGKDALLGANNALALKGMIDHYSDVSNFANGEEIQLGTTDWTFDPFTIDERWGWSIKGNGQKFWMNGGPFTILGCAFFNLINFQMEPITQFAHDGILFDVGTVTGERVHNFQVIDVSYRFFDNALHAIGNISQCWFVRGQYGRSNKSVNFETGFTADHVYWLEPIFSDHNAGQTAFECFINNWELIAAHFETNHGDANTIDINIGGQQGKIAGGVMTQSGAIRFNGNNVTIFDMTINNSCATEVIRNNGGELTVANNKIRWATNDGSGTAFTDGQGKTAIRGAAFRGLSDNEIKRPGRAIHITGNDIAIDNNFIDDPAEYAYLLDNTLNVKISGGTVALKKVAAIGVRQQTGNANGCSATNINWKVDAGEKYSFLGGNFQVHESGEGSPNGVLYGGSGSTYSRVNNPVIGRANYVKTTAATSNVGWYPVGEAQETVATLGNAASTINTEDKFRGVTVLTDATQKLTAESSAATGRWFDSDGNVVVTPS